MSCDHDFRNGTGTRRPAETDEERHAEHAVRLLTAMDPDKAFVENEAGWSKADVYLGHALDRSVRDGGLTEDGWTMAQKLVKKYHRQVGNSQVATRPDLT